MFLEIVRPSDIDTSCGYFNVFNNSAKDIVACKVIQIMQKQNEWAGFTERYYRENINSFFEGDIHTLNLLVKDGYLYIQRSGGVGRYCVTDKLIAFLQPYIKETNKPPLMRKNIEPPVWERYKPNDLYLTNSVMTSITSVVKSHMIYRVIVVSNLLIMLQRNNNTWHRFTWQEYLEFCNHKVHNEESNIIRDLVKKGWLDLSTISGETFAFTEKLINRLVECKTNVDHSDVTFD